METYQIKPETLAKLRARLPAIRERRAPYSTDVLNQTLQSYYDKPQYSRRTDKWRTYPGSWQPLDSMGPHDSKSERAYYADQFPDWRDLGFADSVDRSITHNGWYCDHWQDDVCRGQVLQLPARKGETIYIPGITWTNQDGVTLWPLDWYETPEECARAADSYAKHAAEQEREYQAKAQAEQDIQHLQDDIKDARKTVHALIADIRESKEIKPTICSVLRERIREERNQVMRAIAEIRKLRDSYWYAVEKMYR